MTNKILRPLHGVIGRKPIDLLEKFVYKLRYFYEGFSTGLGDYNILNPCKPDMYWVRGIDVVPILLDKSEILAKQIEFEEMLGEI